MNDITYYVGLIVIGFCTSMGAFFSSWLTGRVMKKQKMEDIVDAVLKELEKRGVAASKKTGVE